MGPGRSSVLRIGSNPTKASSSGRIDGGNDSLAVVVHQAALEEPHFPLDKGNGKINEIRYPSGSEYLRAAIQIAEAVGPSRVEPLYGDDRPKTRCIKCTPMCASARVAPSNIVYSWYGYRSTGTGVLTTKVLLFR